MIKMVNISYRIKKIMKILRTGKKVPDDYDWQYYADLYRAGLEDVAKDHTLAINKGDYVFQNGRLEIQNKILPLHPNYSIIYETLLQLAPDGVMEIGCGCGDHLHNIAMLSDKIKLHGIDVSNGQLLFLKNRHPELKAWVNQYDITTDPEKLDLPKVDIAYTQAVIMHIRKNHLHALINLFQIATNQVILMENWKRHEFMPDINRLFTEKKLPWENIHFHYRESEIIKKPHLMIISKKPLKQYPALTDYAILRDTITAV